MDAAALRYLTNAAGKRIAVVVPIREYEELMEDLHDLATLAERRNEPTISFEALVANLKQDGLLPG